MQAITNGIFFIGKSIFFMIKTAVALLMFAFLFKVAIAIQQDPKPIKKTPTHLAQY